MSHCGQRIQCPSVCACGVEVKDEIGQTPVLVHWDKNPFCKYGSILQRITWSAYASQVNCPSCKEKM